MSPQPHTTESEPPDLEPDPPDLEPDPPGIEPEPNEGPAMSMSTTAMVGMALNGAITSSLCFGVAWLLGWLGHAWAMWGLCVGVAVVFSGAACVIGLAPERRKFRMTIAHLDEVRRRNLTGRIKTKPAGQPGYNDEFEAIIRAVNRTTRAMSSMIGAMRTTAGTLGHTSAGLMQASERFVASTADSAARAVAARGAADQVAADVESLAAAAEEFSASIMEIVRATDEISTVAGDSMARAESAREVLARLARSSAEIGSAMSTVTTIAEQTNLLALNATIEAARAGAAGRGFAVVASAVKDLAQATADATDTIAGRIEAIQADTTKTVEAIRDIVSIIGDTRDGQVAIASTVEAQAQISEMIAARVNAASALATTIAASINRVAESGEQGRSDADQAHQAATDLSTVVTTLEQLATGYRI